MEKGAHGARTLSYDPRMHLQLMHEHQPRTPITCVVPQGLERQQRVSWAGTMVVFVVILQVLVTVVGNDPYT